jgi:carboxymethylenebutenolidase
MSPTAVGGIAFSNPTLASDAVAVILTVASVQFEGRTGVTPVKTRARCACHKYLNGSQFAQPHWGRKMERALTNVGASLFRMILMLTLAGFALSTAPRAQEMNRHHIEGSSMSIDSELVQDWARERLAKSPRHREWVKVKNGNREVNSFIVYPEVNKKATAVIVIHEIFGMTDWVQQLADELAEAGYIAIAPDLLSGMGPNGGGTTEIAVTGSNAVGQAIRALPPDQIASDLNAVADYISKLPSANGKVAVGGFCWGGTQTFFFATKRPGLKAAFVFYGTAPANNGQSQTFTVDKSALARIGAPVYGFYAENDMRIDATIPPTADAMKELRKIYDPLTYAGAGHGFMRAGEPNAPEPKAPAAKGDEAANKTAADDYQKALTMDKANRKARNDAWERWKALLAKL